MKLLTAFLLVTISCIQINDESFEKVMTDLENLEAYIREYRGENKNIYSPLTHLIVCYIRLGGYSTQEWAIAAGSIPEDLEPFIKAKDEERGTTAQATRTYRNMVMPNGDTVDFVHMFATMNGLEYSRSYSSDIAHLVGWGGDDEQLIEDIMDQEGDIESLMEYAKNNFFRKKGEFDEGDLIADLDAPILLDKKTDNNTFADLMRVYYNKVQSDEERVTQFVEFTFPSLIGESDKEKFRKEIYNIYNKDYYINVLECKAEIRNGSLSCIFPSELVEKYKPHQKAAVYVVSDFFCENYKPSIPPEEEEEEKEKEKEEEKEKEKDKEKEKEGESEGEGSDSGSVDPDPTDGSQFLNNNLIYIIFLIGNILNLLY